MELYGPSTRPFTATGTTGNARDRHTATESTRGTTLVVGRDESAEFFDRTTGAFAFAGHRVSEASSEVTASLRSNGTVLVAGGSLGLQACPRHGRCPLTLRRRRCRVRMLSGSLQTARESRQR
jgi:hypothetical protein